MILVLDVGNTNIAFGAYEGEKLLFSSRMATDGLKMEDEYAVELCGILRLHGIASENMDGAAIGSVVPRVTPHLLGALRKITANEPVCVGPETKTGIRMGLDAPQGVGADLLMGCVAAAELFNGPCIILDMGTATKFVVLDENRTMLGGAIVPGLGISLDALTNRAALLPYINPEPTEQVIGKGTVECMRSGLMIGAACMIDGMCGRIEQELGKKCNIVATGGFSRDVIGLCERDILYSENLLLNGLRIIYEMNREN